MKNKKIILASQSVQRRILMETLGIPFEVMPADIDEKSIVHKDAKVRAQLVARAKATTTAQQFKEINPNQDAVIIAADTFGFLNDQQFEKPATKAEAITMLTQLSSTTSVAITGFCVIDTEAQTEETEVVVTKMQFRPLTSKEIERYVSENEVTSWSGGFSPDPGT